MNEDIFEKTEKEKAITESMRDCYLDAYKIVQEQFPSLSEELLVDATTKTALALFLQRNRTIK